MILPMSEDLDSRCNVQRAYALMSSSNLISNARRLKQYAKTSRLIAMVKANGFGHGIRSCSLRLADEVDAFGVAHVDEAVILRKVGVKTPIFLMEGVYNLAELELAQSLDVVLVCHSEHQLALLAHCSQPTEVWLKVDTGMGRLGFSTQDVLTCYPTMVQYQYVKQPVGIMSHFACASEPGHALNTHQKILFTKLCEQLQAPASFCNSAAIFHFMDCHYDYVRPGLALYGVSPTAKHASDYGLKSVMCLKSQVIAVRDFVIGDSIGYGASYVCTKPTRVAIVAMGYGDGYPRDVSSEAVVIINGVRCPIVGTISMDMMCVDISACEDAAPGDEVVLWGRGLPVEEVAIFSKRSCYELLTSVQHRVKFTWT